MQCLTSLKNICNAPSCQFWGKLSTFWGSRYCKFWGNDTKTLKFPKLWGFPQSRELRAIDLRFTLGLESRVFRSGVHILNLKRQKKACDDLTVSIDRLTLINDR